MRHHMAPVASGIADRKEDRLVLDLGEAERRRPPRMPIDWIVLVLEQIGARFAG